MSFTIAHLSDPHLGPLPAFRLRDFTAKRAMGYVNWKRGRERLNDMGMLKRLVADMRSQKPDHVAMTGDVVNIGLPAEFAAAAAWMHTLGDPERREFHAGQSRRLCASLDALSGRRSRALDVRRRRRGAARRRIPVPARARRCRADRPFLGRADRTADGDRANGHGADGPFRRDCSTRRGRADWRGSC